VPLLGEVVPPERANACAVETREIRAMSDMTQPTEVRGPAMTVVQVPAPTTSTPTVPGVLPTDRVASKLEGLWRLTAAVVGVAVLAFACVLAWREETEGVAAAAAFAVAILTLIFAFAGVVPASIKIGDLITIENAKNEGKKVGKLEGLVDGAKVATAVQTANIDKPVIEEAVKKALTTNQPLRLGGIEVPVPKLESDQAAEQCTADFVDALT
jgi:hypothetical protein